MPFLVYRQDTHGTRYLVQFDLDGYAAKCLIENLTAGREHHQAYFVAEYLQGQLDNAVGSLGLLRQ